jgi:hypothetical protein
VKTLIEIEDQIKFIGSEDIKEFSEILIKMKARFKSIEKRGENHLRCWVVNKDNVGVCWIIFQNLRYSSMRFHRSSFEFNCTELQLRVDNWQLRKEVDFERNERLNLHYKLKSLNDVNTSNSFLKFINKKFI